MIDYSDNADCKLCDGPALTTFNEGTASNCTCVITFDLTSKWQGDVFFYYGLTNFYQVKKSLFTLLYLVKINRTVVEITIGYHL